MEPSTALQVVAILCALPAFPAALFLESRRERLRIGTRPYTWAYFQGTGSLLFGSVGSIATLLADGWTEEPGAIAFGLLLFATYAVSGWYVVRRRRWAWVLFTVMTVNPISWIVNYIYGRNRWAELVPLGREPDPTPDVKPSVHAAVEGHASSPDAMLDHLERLADLRRQGALTPEEFDHQKARILGNQSTPHNE